MDTNAFGKYSLAWRVINTAIPICMPILLAARWASRTNPQVQIASSLIILVFFIYAFYRYNISDPQIRVYPLALLPIAGLWLYQAVLVPFAPLPEHSFDVHLDLLITYAASIAIIVGLKRIWKAKILENTLIFIGLLFIFTNLSYTFSWFDTWWTANRAISLSFPFGYRLPGAFLHHPNIEAAFLNLIIPLILLRILRGSFLKKSFYSIYLALTLVVLFFSSSRGAWISLLLASGTFVTLITLDSIQRHGEIITTRLRNVLKPRNLILFSAGAAILITIGVLFSIQSRITPHARGINARSYAWGVALEIIRQAPILGHGPGSFDVLSAVYAKIPPGFYLIHAHNLILQIVAESGLLGLLLTSISGLYFLRSSVFVWKTTESFSRQKLSAYIAALVSVLLHSLVDLPFVSPLILFVTLIYASLMLRNSRSVDTFRVTRLAIVSFMTLTIAFITTGVLTGVRSERYYFDGILIANQGRWTEAERNICRSSSLDSDFRLYKSQCNILRAILAYPDEGLSATIDKAEITLEFDDAYWPITDINNAYLMWYGGMRTAAVEELLRVAEQIPRNDAVHLGLGWMYHELSDMRLSQYHYAQAIKNNPWLARSSHIKALELSSQQVDSSIVGSERVDIINAVYGWIELDQGNLTIAKDYLNTAIELNPRRSEAYSGLGYIEAIQGNFDAARYWLAMSELTQRKSYIDEQAKLLIGSLNNFDDLSQIQHLDFARILYGNSYSAEYYTNAYWRKSLPIDFIPQAIQGVITPEIEAQLKRLNGDHEFKDSNPYAALIAAYLADDVKR